MILGVIANIAGYATGKAVMKTLTKEVVTNANVVDKVLIPVGSFIISCMVGDACQKYTESQIKEAKETVAEVAEKIQEVKNKKDEPKDDFDDDFFEDDEPAVEHVNVFEQEPISEEEARKEEVQDGDSTDA